MRLTLRQIHESNFFLQQLSNMALDLDVSITVSQALAVFETQVKIINKAIADKATLMGFVIPNNPQEPYRSIDPTSEGLDGQKDYTVPQATIEKFESEVNEHLDKNFVNIPVQKITRKQLFDNKVKTTPNMLLRLDWLFDLHSKAATEERDKATARSKKALSLVEKRA